MGVDGFDQDAGGDHEELYIARMPEDLWGRIEALAEHWERPVGHVVHVLLSRGLRDAESMQVCRDCGCTDFDPCGAADEAYGCAWVVEDLCSFCADLNEGVGTVEGKAEEGKSAVNSREQP